MINCKSQLEKKLAADPNKSKQKQEEVKEDLIKSNEHESAKCTNGHPALFTTQYPSGGAYPSGYEHVVCTSCGKRVTCKEGYWRCSDDGSTCEDDWCLDCKGPRKAEQKCENGHPTFWSTTISDCYSEINDVELECDKCDAPI